MLQYFTFGMQYLGFAIAAILQTEVFYDILGGTNFLVIAVISSFALFGNDVDLNVNTNAATNANERYGNQLFVGLFVISRGWLLLFLAWRAHHRQGDSRFDGVKTVPLKFFVYWTVQAIWVYCISLPLLLVMMNVNSISNNNKYMFLRMLLLLGMA